jgi:hypothetical protein
LEEGILVIILGISTLDSSMKARFVFELGKNNNHVFDSKQKKIKALHIQFF